MQECAVSPHVNAQIKILIARTFKMKIKLARIIAIPVPKQSQKEWTPIVHQWISENNDKYPDDIIELVDPCIDYYQRSNGERMMEGKIEITMSYLVDATTTDSLPL